MKKFAAAALAATGFAVVGGLGTTGPHMPSRVKAPTR